MDNKNDSNLIFIDYDFLDTENAKRIRKENTIGYVRDFYTKHNILRKIHNEPEMFAQLTDDETLTMYSWDRGRIERIDYRKWYCGHYHTAKKIDKIQFMYEDIDVLQI